MTKNGEERCADDVGPMNETGESMTFESGNSSDGDTAGPEEEEPTLLEAFTESSGRGELPGQEEFMPSKYWLDMRGAPAESPRNAEGWQRNARWFWRELLELYPEIFSRENKEYIRTGLAPIVDEQWLEYHPGQELFEGDFLIHHHVDRGPIAAGIPRRFHQIFHGPLHY